MRNLNRATNYYNNLQARVDYAVMVERARSAGVYVVPVDVSEMPWRRIDKHIGALRTEMGEQREAVPA